MRRLPQTRPSTRARPRPPAAGAAGAPAPGQVELSRGLLTLSEGALHITVYDLLAHAYDRVAIQYYHDQGASLLVDPHRYLPTLFAPALPPTLQREVVAALLADSARALATFFDFEEMNFVLLDHEQAVYRLVVREGAFFPRFRPGVYTQPFGTGLLGQCHIERRTVLVNDVKTAGHYVQTDPAVRAELCVPVVLGDDVLAIIDTGATRVDAFTAAHAAFIEGFARYLGPAIADPLAFLQAWRPGLVHAASALAPLAQSLNFLYAWHEEWRSRFAQLYTEVSQRNAELLALIDLSASLSSSLRLDVILRTTVAKVAQLLSCQVSWILLPDDDGRLRIRALHGGMAASPAEAANPTDGGPQFVAFTTGEAVIMNDLSRVPRSSFDWTFCRRNEITRYVAVPLRVRERTIGVMNVGRTHASEDLTDQDVRLLSTFANQIALAIENADLYERSRLLGAMEERNRLARDLHDTLVQSVVGILRSLEDVDTPADRVPPTLHEAIEQARALARQCLDEARRSVWNLQPAELDRQSLWEALDTLVATWGRQTGAQAHFELLGTPEPLPAHVEADVLHIAREALSNAARHAAARHVTVCLRFSAAGVRLTLTDDGVGFDPNTQPERLTEAPLPEPEHVDSHTAEYQGLGLRGMRQRARLLGAWLQVESAPGWGTRIVLTVPTNVLRGTSNASGEDDTRQPPSNSPTPATRDAQERMSASRAPEPDAAPAARQARPSKITVLLADDHPAVREGLRIGLSKVAGVEVAGMAASGPEAVEMACGLRPDVLLLDMHMPGEDGLGVLRRLRDASLATRVIMLTAHASDANIAEALRAGAAGYLQKDIEMPRLVEAIRAVMQGRPAFSPGVASRLRERVGLLVNVRAGQLTSREREILQMLATGMRYRAIAQRLCIAEATVKFHTVNLYQKLHSSSRVEALNRAREWGLLG